MDWAVALMPGWVRQLGRTNKNPAATNTGGRSIESSASTEASIRDATQIKESPLPRAYQFPEERRLLSRPT